MCNHENAVVVHWPLHGMWCDGIGGCGQSVTAEEFAVLGLKPSSRSFAHVLEVRAYRRDMPDVGLALSRVG